MCASDGCNKSDNVLEEKIMLNGDISNQSEPVVFIDGRGFVFNHKSKGALLKECFSSIGKGKLPLWNSFELAQSAIHIMYTLKKYYPVVVLADNTCDENFLCRLFENQLGCTVLRVSNVQELSAVISRYSGNFILSNLFRKEFSIIAGVMRYDSVEDAVRKLYSVIPR